jgi:hypothetical protein
MSKMTARGVRGRAMAALSILVLLPARVLAPCHRRPVTGYGDHTPGGPPDDR